jgi:lysophospholipase L1-like esterase
VTPRRLSASVLGLLLLLPGCTAPATTTVSRAEGGPAAASPTSAELRVFAVGDSITEADSDDFDSGDIGLDSWATYADGPGITVVGGWAHAGATTEDMLAGALDLAATGTGPTRDDVLVLMGGSNDIDEGVAIPTIMDNLVRIATGLRTGRVTLSTIPPEDGVEDEVEALNAHLPALAAQEGWQLVDPMQAVRGEDGGWLPGMSDDGVHPTRPAAALIGESFRRALIG